MNYKINLLGSYLDELEKIAAEADSDQTPVVGQRAPLVSREAKQDLAVGAVMSGASALKQGVDSHNKQKRKRARRQAGWEAMRSSWGDSKDRAGKISRSRPKTRGGKAKKMFGGAATKGTAGPRAVGAGIRGMIGKGIKDRLGLDQEKKTGLRGAASAAGSVGGKTWDALSSKKTKGSFNKGVQMSQAGRALGILR